MKNKINYDKITKALEKGVTIVELSNYGKFAIQCLGYNFHDEKGQLIYKYELFERGFNDIKKLLNGEYPIKVKKRKYI